MVWKSQSPAPSKVGGQGGDARTDPEGAGETNGLRAPHREVSVVIPAYNAEDTIGDCLRALEAQSYPVNEIIVVDDCSSDATAGVVGRFDCAVIHKLAERCGAGTARAVGANLARCGIVAFIDSDCVAPPNWVAIIIEEFERNPNLGAVGGGYQHDPTQTVSGHLSRLEAEYLAYMSAQNPMGTTLLGGNMAVLKSVWARGRSGREQIYFRSIASGEDVVLCADLREIAEVAFVPSLTVHHRAVETARYFRRHIDRGLSGMTILLNGLQGKSDTSLALYGGMRLITATAFLALAMATVPVPFLYSQHALPAAVSGLLALVLYMVLSAPFFRFIGHSNDAFELPYRVTFGQQVVIRVCLLIRLFCWGIGATLSLWRHLWRKARLYWNVLCSIAHFFRPWRVSKLFYFVTAQCNARCSFCFNLENVVNWAARKPKELTLEEVTRIARNFGRLPYITMSGGEPFVRKDLADVVEAFYRESKTQWVTIPSNGALSRHVLDITRDILVRCPDLFLTIQISLDSLYEDHDKSRKLSGGFEAMTETLKMLAHLRKHHRNLRVQIATCYDDFNVGRIPEIVEYCKANFDYDQQFFYLIRDGEKRITKQNNHLVKGYIEFLMDNERREWQTHRRTLWSRAARALQGLTYADLFRIKLREEFVRPCHATAKFVTLYDDGQVSPCEVLDHVNYGNVRDFDYDFSKLIKQNKVRAYYRDKIVGEKCNCEWMCALPINMLYDSSTYFRVAKAFVHPDRAFDDLLHGS